MEIVPLARNVVGKKKRKKRKRKKVHAKPRHSRTSVVRLFAGNQGKGIKGAGRRAPRTVPALEMGVEGPQIPRAIPG